MMTSRQIAKALNLDATSTSKKATGKGSRQAGGFASAADAARDARNTEAEKKIVARQDARRIIAAKHAADRIANDLLDIATLTPANNDRRDFHEIACWNLQAALVEAYLAGHAAAKK